jgi:transmembrane sensor
MQTPDDNDPIRLEAFRWLVRLGDAKATAQNRAEFATWLDADPRHRTAWEHAKTLSDRFDAAADAIREAGIKGPPPKGTTRRTFLLVAGSAAAGAAWWSYGRRRADHVTGVGERRMVALPDGTQAELGALTELSLRFTPGFRRVVLHAGEVFFDTAPDAARPFIVEAGDGTAQALGTGFNVRHIDGQTTVAVFSKRVLVRVGTTPAVELQQGYQVSYAGEAIGRGIPADLAAVRSWRNDRLVLHDVPLTAVLAELERYRRGRIFLLGEGLGRIPVTAVFDTREPDAALDTIAATLSLRVRRLGSYLAVISRDS